MGTVLDGWAAVGESMREAQRAFETSPAAVLALLREAHGLEPDPECPEPVEVLEILSARVLDTFRQSGSEARARVRCSDGSERIASGMTVYIDGRGDDPPDGDVEFAYEDPS